MQMLKQENKSAMEAFREVLEKVEQSHTQFTVDMLWVSSDFLIDLFNLMTQELSGVNLRSDYEDGYEEEDVNSKGEHFLLCCAI
jgi:hypothetical protein